MHFLILIAVVSSSIATVAGAPSLLMSTSDHNIKSRSITECKNLELGPQYMKIPSEVVAWCPDSSGPMYPSMQYTSLDLTLCIANDFGQLAARDMGGFAGSCKSLSLDGSILHASCATGKHNEFKDTTIDLNSFLENDNSVLHCGSHYAKILGRTGPF
ncbi:hypothetical protein F4808DRAFT_410099 [Astrocystis sublimbata]|nr:hypothetical protein F4808DRAFT_410099 [Astrocystis sublimbata]